MILPAAAGILRGALDLVFAPVCVACDSAIPAGETDRLVCRPCWSRAKAIPPPFCPRCSTPRPARLPGAAGDAPTACADCATLPPAVRAVRAAYLLQGPARPVVHALKYRGWRAVADPMAARMAAVPLPLEVEEEVRLLVAVPTSAVRLRERGYNQAVLLAAALASRTGRESRPDLLVRTRSVETQTALHPAERRANVAGAFAVPADRRSALWGEHVLIVDDVWTTGATALACAAALLEGGARAVSVLTFARALPALTRGEITDGS